MPFASLTLKPGVNLEQTPTLNQAGVVSSQFVRWREGLPEKRGGWAKYINAVLTGTPKALHAWEDLNQGLHLAVGTTQRLYVITNGSVADVTARSEIVSAPVIVDTTNGSPIITVHDTGRNATVYDVVVFNVPVSIGGVVLSGAYQIIQSGGADEYQITAAIDATSTVAGGGAVPSLTSASGTPAVVVTLNNHGYTVGQTFAILVPTSVGGITFSGQYLITNVTGSNTFVINGTSSASSAATVSMNGGNMSLTYFIAIGPSIAGAGYGVGPFGSGGYGTGTTPSGATGVPLTTSDYWLDNWGEILLSNPVGNGIFTWSPDTGYANASLIPEAPLANAGMFVAMPQQQIMAWGSTTNGISDPLLIRWCDAGNYSVWTPQSANQAGSYRIPTGSRIIGGLQSSQQCLFWTDIDIYAAQYTGQPFVWGFNKLSSGCGLIAPKAAGILGSTTYWMSQRQFFVYGGNGVQPIDCQVWDAIFQNLNADFVSNVRFGANSQFNEVSWDYPSTASVNGENDTRITYNVVASEWDIQPINRSAWIDQSVLGPPIGTSSNGYVYQHEVSSDADGQPLAANFTSGYFCISEAEDMVFVDWMFPDFKWGYFNQAQSSTMKMMFNVTKYPGDTPKSYGPYMVTAATEYISPRFRGRYVQFIVGSEDLGSFWRLGRIRYRFAGDGRV